VRVATSRGSRQNVFAALWALVGALVVVYLFFIVLGDKKPGDAPVVSGIALALAVVWLGHSWRRLWGGGAISPPDRERRGF
jgi:high-affinity Fe2+/Pb2+ permease